MQLHHTEVNFDPVGRGGGEGVKGHIGRNIE